MRALWLYPLAAGLLCAQSYSPAQKQLDLQSFEKVWTTVRDKHWEKNPGGLDWDAIHAEFRPLAEAAASRDEARKVMQDMLARLKQTHFGIVPAVVYDKLGAAGGDGTVGIDIRILDGKAIITEVQAGSPAEAAGIRTGWQLLKVQGEDLAPVIEQLSTPGVTELTRTRAILSRVSGGSNNRMLLLLRDGNDATLSLDLHLVVPRGNMVRFGNLPDMRVWLESKKLNGAGKPEVGYIRFNMFLDPERLMPAFADAVGACRSCRGLIIDLRGNPGGIGGMAMGMAGFVISKQGMELGKMYMRDVTLNYVVNPRAGAFEGPVAILLDGTSASTAEIFAGGLKDLGRARIFGTRSAGAALPSLFERLPNGDGFQYAVAGYRSEGGKPLEGLGVEPDVKVALTRDSLLSGRHLVLEAALEWIQNGKESKE